MPNSDYVWYTPLSQQFLENDYLRPGETLDERVDVICQTAERLLAEPGFAARFKANLQKGWYSLSTPIWTNFGTERGLPISCFGSTLSDNMESILGTLAEVGMMTKLGGGTSAFFGNLRPRGTPIRENGESCGAVHFMQLYDGLINTVSQGKCYIEGTEVLTAHGFKDFRLLTPTDRLAQVDSRNNIDFTDRYELVVEAFTGELICFTGRKNPRGISLKVTPDHRMVVERQKMKMRQSYWPGETEIVRARDLNLHRDNRFVLAGWAGSGAGLSDRDRLRIAFQADGTKDGPHRRIRFHLQKERKVSRLLELLDRLGIERDRHENPDGTLDISFAYSPDLKRERFTDWVQLADISGTWAEEFLAELTHWDGTTAHGGAAVYSSTEASNIDCVQAVAALAQRKTRCWQRPGAGPRQTLHSICVSEGMHRGGESVAITREAYDGPVYCAIVPQGRLIVRYEGHVMVCGNTRRGNFAAYLPIDHPDIGEFLAIRSEGAPIQDLSFGVCIPDRWMEAMVEGDAAKRKIWARVLECRANVGFPYLFFEGNANKDAPRWYQDQALRITHSNLCSEIMLPDNDAESFVCDLSSMNILHFEAWKDTDAVALLVAFLDAVMTEFIEKAEKIPFMERAANFGRRHRALGIGWIGYHSFLQSQMLPFDSLAAKGWNAKIASTIWHQAEAASQALAVRYGEPEVLVGYGRRNTTLCAIAPTKSSAFILGQVSEGIEPHRANVTIKDLAKGKFTVQNPQLKAVLAAKGKDDAATWGQIMRAGGSVQQLECLNEAEKAVFKTFSEISPMEIVLQAAQRQLFIDQGQSLNLMIHPSVPIKDVNALMIKAWEMGVKSLYYQISVNAAQEFARDILSCSSCEG